MSYYLVFFFIFVEKTLFAFNLDNSCAFLESPYNVLCSCKNASCAGERTRARRPFRVTSSSWHGPLLNFWFHLGFSSTYFYHSALEELIQQCYTAQEWVVWSGCLPASRSRSLRKSSDPNPTYNHPLEWGTAKRNSMEWSGGGLKTVKM